MSMLQSIIQINPPIWVQTPLGDGLALFLIDYGVGHNTCWVVGLEEDGQIKHFDSNDIKLCFDFTYGVNLPNKLTNKTS